MSVALGQQQVDSRRDHRVSDKHRQGVFQGPYCFVPPLPRHGDSTIQVLGVAGGKTEPLQPLDPGDRAFVPVEFLLIDQRLRQQDSERNVERGGGDTGAEESLGSVRMVVGQLDLGGHAVEDGVLGVTVQATVDGLPRLGELPVLAGEFCGGDQHLGVVGAELQSPGDVAGVGGGADVTITAPAANMRQRLADWP